MAKPSLLSLGLDHHRNGRLDEAASIYQQLLAENPDDPDALHLLGVIRHQRGQDSEAVSLIERAIAIRSGNASFHSNLADAQQVLGRLKEAEANCRTALTLQPEYPDALHNLGVSLFKQGRYPEAERVYRDSLLLRPDFSLTLAALADSLREQGRVGEALASYRRALELKPDDDRARANYGLLLSQCGRLEEGLEHCRHAVALNPNCPITQGNLGRMLLEYGQLDEATDVLADALRLDPESPTLADTIGRSWVEVGDFREAKSWFERALRLNPELHEARCHLATVHFESGDLEGAAGIYRDILGKVPTSAEAHIGLARTLLEQGDVVGAVKEHRDAIQLRPEAAALYAALGNTLSTAGDLDAAIASHRRAIELNSRCVPAYSGLATALRGKTADDDVRRIEELLRASWMTYLRRASLHFALAQVFDGRGEWETAEQHMVQANTLQKSHYDERDQEYDPADHRAYIDQLIATFTTSYFDRIRDTGNPSTRPVFVVGMPRSGTTLTEQILASHPLVWGAGERRFVHLGFQLLPLAMGIQESPTKCLDHLPHPAIEILAEGHLAKLREINPDRPHIVDKMPDNYQLLGWIATLFPRAKVIHCTRDVRDVALSCWITNFARIRWANDLEHLAERINDYRRIMDHYRKVLPVPVFEVDYAQMVADQEGTTRRLLEFVGLDWDLACLNFHQTERLVRTASVAQVRQPIYGRSVARWRRYQTALKPLLDRLGRLDWLGETPEGK